jgi:glycosidase
MTYINNLGVTALYLNPIFESPSNHKYDTTDFFHIDDNFGTLTDFQALTDNSYGIEVVLDGVFNHSSSDSIYFDRYDRWNATTSGPAQPFPTPVVPGTSTVTGACETNNVATTDFVNWYTFFNYEGEANAPCSDNLDYPKWFGIFDSLPVLQHDYGPVRSYFLTDGTNAVAPYWLSQGADGWRLDVAPEIDHGQINDPGDDYMETLRDAARAQDPNAYIVGEEWGNATSWVIGANNTSNGEWDATMNYQFASAVLSFWRSTYYQDNDFNPGSSAGPLDPLEGAGVNERLLRLQEIYPTEAYYAMMNLFNSHDTNRVLVLLNQGPQGTADFNNPNYDWSGAIQRLYGATIMQFTLPGAPTIYYGDEVGTVNPPAFDGSTLQDDPYNRVPYPWLDETGIPYYTHMQSATGPRADLLAHYQTLTGIRNSIPALRTGSFDPLYTDANIYAYGRKDATSAAVVLVNKSEGPQSVIVDLSGYLPASASYTDQINGGTFTTDASGALAVTVPAQFGLILTPDTAGTLPACVTDLAATALSATQIDLNWSAASGAGQYEIWRSRLSGGGYDLIDTVMATVYSDATVSPATEYHYRVVPVATPSLLHPDLYCNNEASITGSYDLTDPGTSWFNLQFPQTLTTTVSATTPTDAIYGQIWINGVTGGQNDVDPTPGLIAQVGWGPDGTLPTDPNWVWVWLLCVLNSCGDTEQAFFRNDTWV